MRYAILLILAGCATDGRPIEQRYEPQSWATATVYQVHAECLAIVQAHSDMGFDVCMNAKGWKRR